MTIAVDFDGTIVEHKYPEIGKEIPFAIATLKKLQDGGHKLILWTVREGKHLDEAVSYCHEKGLDFFAVNSEYPESAWNGDIVRKIRADIYIDDRNLGGIPDWGMIYDMITSHMTYNDMITKMSDPSIQDDDNPYSGIHSGTFRRERHHHHHHRKGLFHWIVDRCRAARFRYNG